MAPRGLVLRFRVDVAGLEHLPRDGRGRPEGGWIAAGLPHRSWIDPFLLWLVLPPEPRLVFFGDARTMARSRSGDGWCAGSAASCRSRRTAGPRAFAIHVAAASEVLASGAVFCLFPESGAATPAGTTRPISPGIAYVAMRSEARIVPIVIGGNDVLFLGRRVGGPGHRRP